MKVLILSCNTGQGHNVSGNAIMSEFEKKGIECDLLDTLSFRSEMASNVVTKIHTGCVMHAPRLFSVGFRTAELIDEKSFKYSPCYVANATYADELYQYIKENGFDTIIMPHVFPAEALTRIKRKYAPDLKTYFVATDYTYPIFLRDTEVDRYFIAHDDLADEFARNGIPKSKLTATGIPISPDFAKKIEKSEAKKQLGLDVDKAHILVMTGSLGFGNTIPLVTALLNKLPGNTHLVVMGGSNEKMKKELRTRFLDDPRLTVLDFTNKVSLYMDACDVLLTKPGGLSSTEAAVKEIPTIFTTPIPGWEENNIDFFQSHNLALAGDCDEDLVTQVLYLLSNPWKCEKMSEMQRQHINKNAAKSICEFILQDSR